jgi:hypothetical protein
MLRLLSWMVVPLLSLFALLVASAVVQPQYTWDLVGYIGCSVDGGNPRAIHPETFAARREISNDEDVQLDNPYGVDVAANPYHFSEQLPFYSIKPICVLPIKAFHRLGERGSKGLCAHSCA